MGEWVDRWGSWNVKDEQEALALLAELAELERAMRAAEAAGAIEAAHPEWRASARNLLHYAAARRMDLRPLQGRLSALGLSSLGRMESCALASVQAVMRALGALAGRASADPGRGEPPVRFSEAPKLLARHTDALFGPPPPERPTRIMVTMPTEAAEDQGLLRDLLGSGMDAIRINTAHDDPEVWHGMIDRLERARAEVGRPCRIYADLAGPKLRTGPLPVVGRIARVHPKQGLRGEVLEPGRIVLRSTEGTAAISGAPAGLLLRVAPSFFAALRDGDELVLLDCRGRERRAWLRGPMVLGQIFVAELDRTLYLEDGAPLWLEREGQRIGTAEVQGLPEVAPPLRLKRGDRLTVVPPGFPPAEPGALRISCSHPEIIAAAKPGHRISFDDGALGGVIESVAPEGLIVRLTEVPAGGRSLGAEKGINLPDSDLALRALTADDLAAFESLVARVDVFGLSFVRTSEDVHEFADRLVAAGAPEKGIVLKIENQTAFRSLPRLLLAGLSSPPLGVMIARGDLAVELGFSRLAEAQEELLWFAEAAHVPVIWATQVLENLAKRGVPSRAEVSDVALAVRSECVMLNKGPCIVEAVRFLSETLCRMEDHVSKKRSLLRRLEIASFAP